MIYVSALYKISDFDIVILEEIFPNINPPIRRIRRYILNIQTQPYAAFNISKINRFGLYRLK